MEPLCLLSVKKLSVSFETADGMVDAVKDLDLCLYPGETLGLVGESGCGKSVTALAVMRLLGRSTARVHSGEIWFRHPVSGPVDLLTLPLKQMQSIRGKHLSMIFQEPMTSLNPVKRCGDQLVESLLWHKHCGRREARHRALSLFEEVNLPSPSSLLRAWPHELSGGQKQRVMIAMAMACRPSVLLADEPTTALDLRVQQGILELIVRLQREYGMGVLFISHDLGVIAQLARRAMVMREGRLVESGEVNELFDRPTAPYTRALVACRPPLDARPARLATVEDFMTPSPGTVVKPVPASSGPSRSERHQRMYAGKPILEVKGLRTHYVVRRNLWGRPTAFHKAVNNISFSVYPGETLGLVGESGCGKTTLGRSIMRLINPTGGQVVYKGVNIASLSASGLRKLRPRFQIIFQDPYASLNPGISVGDAIMEPMRVHGIFRDKTERKKRMRLLLEQVGMEERHARRYPHEFSGGQRQRICIARALALNPEFIICDESVSALDVSVQAQVLNLLSDLKDSFGLTYIVISHDLSVVKYLSDRILVMKNGQLVESGEADSLVAHPQKDYTRELIRAIPGNRI